MTINSRVMGFFRYTIMLSSERYDIPEAFMVSFRTSARSGAPAAARISLYRNSNSRKCGSALTNTVIDLKKFFIFNLSDLRCCLKKSLSNYTIILKFCQCYGNTNMGSGFCLCGVMAVNCAFLLRLKKYGSELYFRWRILLHFSVEIDLYNFYIDL